MSANSDRSPSSARTLRPIRYPYFNTDVDPAVQFNAGSHRVSAQAFYFAPALRRGKRGLAGKPFTTILELNLLYFQRVYPRIGRVPLTRRTNVGAGVLL